jgi:hypothetical protein
MSILRLISAISYITTPAHAAPMPGRLLRAVDQSGIERD